MLSTIKEAQEQVFNFYLNQNSNILYYNFDSVKKLIKEVRDNAQELKLNTAELIIMELALLYADCGYFINFSHPYKASADVFKDFAGKHQLEDDLAQSVINCLRVVSGEKPENYLQKITLDFYFSAYGKKKFLKQARLLRKDKEVLEDRKWSEHEWINFLVNRLSNHKYYTEFGVMEWQARKHKHLTSLLNDQNKLAKLADKERLKAKYKTKYKDESPERSIQTLYRVALRNHIKLSDIADTKANILLSVNAIIISLVLANLLSKLDIPSNRYLIVPTIIFVAFSIVSMVMSIKATQPDVTRNDISQDDIDKKKVNLIFFGNFYNLKIEAYQKAVNDLIQDKNDVYNTLTKDLYFLGAVLHAKYRLLKRTYFVFMIGVIISVIAFALAFIYRDFPIL